MVGSVLENREKRQTRVSQMKTLNIFYHAIYWTQKVLQNIMDDMVCWSMTKIQMCSYFIHCYVAIFLHNGFNCCNDLWCHYSCAWPGQGESVTELMPIMNFLVHLYTCSSDRHASPYWTFIHWWILMGFTPTERCSFLVHVASRAAIFTLLLYCTVALHSCILLPPVSHSSNHEYHCCQLTRQLSSVSNFYRTFNICIWLSLV